jgi:hypothetical protein
MDSKAMKAREIQRQIADVLLRHWDPLGVDGRPEGPEGEHEYDAYVGPVYRLLVSGASARAIAEHLVQVEHDALGYRDTDPMMLIPVAEKLRRLNIRLSSDERTI